MFLQSGRHRDGDRHPQLQPTGRVVYGIQKIRRPFERVHNLSGVEVEAGPFYLGSRFDPLYVSPGVPPPVGAKTGTKIKLPPYSTGVWKF